MKCYAKLDELRHEMTLKNLNIIELATASGITSQTACNAVFGRVLKMATCRKIATALGRPVEELFRYE